MPQFAANNNVIAGTYPDESGEPNSAPIAFNIEGDDLGILIGRRGQTLSSLQYILRLIVGHKTNTWIPIVIDAESYKQRRYEAIQALARQAKDIKPEDAPDLLKAAAVLREKSASLQSAAERGFNKDFRPHGFTHQGWNIKREAAQALKAAVLLEKALGKTRMEVL